MKFPSKDFSSKCDQILSFLLILPHLLKKSLMENFIFCAAYHPMIIIQRIILWRKLSSYLVRAKLYPLQKEVDSKKFGKPRCKVAIIEATMFSNTDWKQL